MKCPALIEFYV